MNISIYPYAEDNLHFCKKFQKSLHPQFEKSTFLNVNFNIDGRRNVTQIQVFYSKKNGLFFTKYFANDLIRFAFGEFSNLNFMLAKEKNNPLEPIFIFDFSLKYVDEPYSATFAKINDSNHILSKIYGLTDDEFELLNYVYDIYKLEGEDFCLLDFGTVNNGKKFLRNLVNITEDLNFTLINSNKLTIDKNSLKSIKRRDDSDYNYCMICGSKLEKTIHNALFELSVRFPARCESCLEKIHALELYYDIHDEFSQSNTVSHSELEYKWDDDLLEYNLKLLNENSFLEPFLEGIYKLRPNNNIISVYSPLLKAVEDDGESEFALIDDYLGLEDEIEDENIETECRICGTPLDYGNSIFDSDICSICVEKQMAIEQLNKLLKYVKPGSAFSKDSLIENGLNTLDLEVIIDSLVQFELLYDDMDNLLILESQNVLNDFIKKYSESPEDDLITFSEESNPKQIIYSNYLYEESLDKVFNLIDYQKYIECKQDSKSDSWILIYKLDELNTSIMKFNTPFEAKMAAIRYLDEHDIIDVVPYELGKGDYSDNTKILICPVCGKEFETMSMFSQKYCEECNNIYSHSEKTVLIGIHKGQFTNQTAIEINDLLNQDYTKKDIAKKLKLDNPTLINAIIKFLLPDDEVNNVAINTPDNTLIDEDETTVEGNTADNNARICPVCEKPFAPKGKFNSSQKYCDECNGKYDTFEKNVIIGIKDGIYTRKMAEKIQELLEMGISKSRIAKKFNLKNTSLIDPILKFLLEDSEKPYLVHESYTLDENNSDFHNQKIKNCLVCGNTFVEPKNVSNQKFCNDCRSKYDPFELRVLTGINEGIFDEDLAIRINDLLIEGYPKTVIGRVLSLDDSLINPIIKFLLPETIESPIRSKEKSKKIKTCLVCGKEFIEPKQVSGQKYCEGCKRKYTLSEINVLVGIKEGKYTVEMAKEIRKLQLEGYSNKQIADRFGIHSPLIAPIIKFIPVNDEELGDITNLVTKIKRCAVCDEEFIEPKNVSSQKYCQKCKDKYDNFELNVLVGIKNGKFDENTAIKINQLKEKGKTNKSISTSLHIPIGIVMDLRDILLPDNNYKISDGISFNKKVNKYFVNIRFNNQVCVGLFGSQEEAIDERNKFLDINEISDNLEFDNGFENQTDNDLEIIKLSNTWFVYSGNKLLETFNNKEDAESYTKFYNSLEKSISHPNKQIFKKQDKYGLNIVLKGVISDKDRLSLLIFISTFDCDLNKISCDKLENDYYNVLFDFNLEKSSLHNAMINLNGLGWS